MPRTRLWVLFVALIGADALPERTLAAQGASPTRRNVLIITVDDMSADSLGAFGCRLADTSPHIDRLCQQGMRLHRAHVVVGNCMPSRNVMWSGLYPHRTGVEGFYQ
ncbi:MAG: sulfatase-like hydrolase/transferase, partial [Pirellulaceae bacterium]